MVVATVQAAKVLGIHCAAKKVDSQAALQWLTAIGCDFAQGQALARAQPLDSLASSPGPHRDLGDGAADLDSAAESMPSTGRRARHAEARRLRRSEAAARAE